MGGAEKQTERVKLQQSECSRQGSSLAAMHASDDIHLMSIIHDAEQ